jgi:hypothetical protein
MAKSNKVLNDELRKVFLDKVQAILTESGEEVLVVASNKVAIPCLDSEDNEKWIVLTVTVPSGERGGDGYDGYDEAEALAFAAAACGFGISGAGSTQLAIFPDVRAAQRFADAAQAQFPAWRIQSARPDLTGTVIS